MCRNIKVLFNFDPPATEAEIQDAALQFVRKISGYREPSKANQAAFDRAIMEISESSSKLIRSMKTDAEPKNREEEAQKARERALKRFG